MTIKRDPNAIQVNGALFLVRDPDISTGLFSQYRRLGGLGSFTLPAEAGSTTETALMDGSISFANVAGVGNISGAVGALNAGPVHEFMETKARTGGQVQVAIIRPAVGVVQLFDGWDMTAGAVVDRQTTAGQAIADYRDRRVKIPAATGTINHRSTVVAQVRAGMLAAWDPDAASAAAAAVPASVAIYQKDNPVAADDALWQGILEVAEDGEWMDVAPGFSDDQQAAAANQGVLTIRNGGRKYVGILGSVNQWDRGDHQAGGGITSNFQIVPSAGLATFGVEHRLESDIVGSYETGGSFTV